MTTMKHPSALLSAPRSNGVLHPLCPNKHFVCVGISLAIGLTCGAPKSREAISNQEARF